MLTGFGREHEFISAIMSSGYSGRIPAADSFALRNRVLLLNSPNGVPIDLSLDGLPYEHLVVERSTSFEFETGCHLRTCSAEDLIRQSDRLDWKYIETQLIPLPEVKNDPEILSALVRLQRA